MPDDVREVDERRRAMFEEVGRLERALAKVQSEVRELADVARDLHAREQRFAQVVADREAIAADYDGVRHAPARKELERLNPLDSSATPLTAQLEWQPA